MAGEIIRQGDPTNHGGTVLEGSLTDICHGKSIAYMGHKVVCPKCKGTFPIIEGALTTSLYGKGVALAGMKTACGATLIATQFTDVVEYGGGSAASTQSTVAKSTTAAAGILAAVSATKDDAKKKTIKAISWSYGPDETPVTGVSRFYVDLNLHVKTENYAPGEIVSIVIEDDEGSDVMDGMKTFTLDARVGPDGSAKLMNAFAGKTIITQPAATA